MHKILRRSAFVGVIGFAAGCSGSSTDNGNSTPPPPPPAALANDVNIVVGAQSKGASAFTPNPKSVAASGAATADVRWVNGDITTNSDYSTNYVTHHVVSDDGTSFDTGDLTANATSTKAIAPGTYTYHCEIHPTMKGTVVVSP